MSDVMHDSLFARFQKAGLDVSRIAIAALAFLYGSGYLIQAITLRNYGIQRLESLKFHYVEIGLTFTVLLLLVTVMPAACVHVHYQIRRRSGLPHYHIGAIGFFLNTYNLLFLVVFSGLFVTNREWGTLVFAERLPLSQILVLYLFVAVFVLVVMPIVERHIKSRGRHVRVVYWLFVEPLRFGAVALGILVDVLYVRQFPWMANLGLYGLTFVGSAIALVAIVGAIVYYIRTLSDKYSLPALAAIAATGVLLLFSICVNAYVYSVVRHIPSNRGGRLPITQSFLASENAQLRTIPIPQDGQEETLLFGPVYILEETEDYLYVSVVDDANWFQTWATTYAIRKDSVTYVRNERILVGGPRHHTEVTAEERDDSP